MPDIKETTIIRLLEAGDERCMKMMFDTYYQALCMYVMRYLISVEDAEDIVQRVVLRALEKKEQLANHKKTRPLIARSIARELAPKKRRAQDRTQRICILQSTQLKGARPLII